MRLLLLLGLLLSSLWSTQLDDRLHSIINNQPSLLSQNRSERNVIRQLYQKNHNRPLWIGHANNLNGLREALQNPYFNYKYKDFHQSQIEQHTYLLSNNMNLNQNSDSLATLDILLTRAYIKLVNFIVQSDINWDEVQRKISGLKEAKDISASWEMVRKKSPSVAKLFSAISNQDIQGFLHSITPLPELHKDLIDALNLYQSYRNLPRIKYAKDLRNGDQYAYVADVKRRLILTGDLPNPNNTNDIFNKELEYAINSYKRRYKLEEDGKIDKILVYYLNRPMQEHAQSIITNLDKLKVFPNHFPSEYVRVNLADFTMDYIKNDRSILHMNAVVGRDVRPTPVFSSYMKYLVINPTWNIPENLVRRDLIVALQEHPDYLKEHNIHVFYGWKSKGEMKTFKPEMLFPYADKSKGHIPYRFVQYPGDDNALGRIKFMFPNKYSVYLHDTDNKSLFSRRYRIYSSGCMRLEHPFALLDVLKSRIRSGNWRLIQKYRNTLKTKHINFTKNLPVHTTYFTVFKENGLTQFRKDIYEYDKFVQTSQKQTYTSY